MAKVGCTSRNVFTVVYNNVVRYLAFTKVVFLFIYFTYTIKTASVSCTTSEHCRPATGRLQCTLCLILFSPADTINIPLRNISKKKNREKGIFTVHLLYIVGIGCRFKKTALWSFCGTLFATCPHRHVALSHFILKCSNCISTCFQ